jgi:hypothetical protein
MIPMEPEPECRAFHVMSHDVVLYSLGDNLYRAYHVDQPIEKIPEEIRRVWIDYFARLEAGEIEEED